MNQSLGIIGIGAFGEFMLKYVTPYFNVVVFDNKRDLKPVTAIYNVKAGTLDDVCACDVVVIATPVPTLQSVADQIKSKVKKGQLVMDVASVKTLPTQILLKTLPDFVDIASLHPLFGPQSGKHGIHNLNIAICDVRGGRGACLEKFLKGLGLNTIPTTPEQHDREMAYVQGLTHMIAKIFVTMKLPPMQQTTKTFDLLQELVELVRYDSDELFRAIEKDNPYMAETKRGFFDAVQELESMLSKPAK